MVDVILVVQSRRWRKFSFPMSARGRVNESSFAASFKPEISTHGWCMTSTVASEGPFTPPADTCTRPTTSVVLCRSHWRIQNRRKLRKDGLIQLRGRIFPILFSVRPAIAVGETIVESKEQDPYICGTTSHSRAVALALKIYCW